jgi:hypothetical protein
MTPILDARTVGRIAHMQDQVGILSIYMQLRDDVSGAYCADRSRIEIENRLRDLGESVRAYGDHGYVAAFQACVDWLKPLIESLAGFPADGRSSAVFSGLGSGEVVQVPCGSSMPNVVRLGRVAFLMPLLVAEAAGHPFGVVALHRDEARVFGFKNGYGEEVARLVLEQDSGDWRQLEGPAFTPPGSGQPNVSLRDNFEDRMRAGVSRSLGILAGIVAEMGAAERWDVLVVSGDSRLTNDFKASFRPAGHNLILLEDEHIWGDSSTAEVRRRSAPLVARAREERSAALVTKVVDDSAFGDRAVLGLNATLNALSAGRVRTLLFDAEQMSANGTGAGADRLDRAVRDALVAGIEVVPLSGTGAEILSGAEVGAQLYW